MALVHVGKEKELPDGPFPAYSEGGEKSRRGQEKIDKEKRKTTSPQRRRRSKKEHRAATGNGKRGNKYSS